MGYISAREAAKKWGISQRQVSILCSEKRIPDAIMLGDMWIIPGNYQEAGRYRKHSIYQKQRKGCKSIFKVGWRQ